VSGFDKEQVEALQKQLSAELGTDRVATSCAQVTRVPAFFNHKYRPGPIVTADYAPGRRIFNPRDFPSATAPTAVHSSGQPPHPYGRPDDVRERARKYLAAIPPAVAGNGGDAATFRVCCRLVRGFALHDEEALSVLKEWNHGCVPPWSEEELRAKLRGARRYGREPVGGLLAHARTQSRIG
jgi:hypothetical protein